MVKTYTDWAQEVILHVGVYGATKLKNALERELAKEEPVEAAAASPDTEID